MLPPAEVIQHPASLCYQAEFPSVRNHCFYSGQVESILGLVILPWPVTSLSGGGPLMNIIENISPSVSVALEMSVI